MPNGTPRIALDLAASPGSGCSSPGMWRGIVDTTLSTGVTQLAAPSRTGGRRARLVRMSPLSTIRRCAARHLGELTRPSARRAFRTYDRLGDARRFEPTDALAPALLDAPVSGSIVIDLFGSGDAPSSALRRAMQDLLDETDVHTPVFRTTVLDDDAGPWTLMKTVLLRSDDAPRGLAASKVTKMLHRKRPEFVPIFNSKVAAFYGTTARTPWHLWPVLQQDLIEHHDVLESLASTVTTPDGRKLSTLRALDIIVWEHVVTSCDPRGDRCSEAGRNAHLPGTEPRHRRVNDVHVHDTDAHWHHHLSSPVTTPDDGA